MILSSPEFHILFAQFDLCHHGGVLHTFILGTLPSALFAPHTRKFSQQLAILTVKSVFNPCHFHHVAGDTSPEPEYQSKDDGKIPRSLKAESI